MKKSILYLLVMITSVTMFSCKKLLIESPKALTVEGFYNTAAEVHAGLAAMYEPIRNDMSGYWLAILETQSEWASGQTGSANFDSYRSFKGLSNTGENNLIPRWNAFYVSIRNANL